MTRTLWLNRAAKRPLSIRPTKKHFHALMRNSTPRKLFNLLLCEFEISTGVLSPKSLPYILKLDLTNACNLSCPGCPTGAGLLGRKKTSLSVQEIDRIVEEIGDYTYIAHLYNWGESLLNRDIAAIVKRLSDANIYTSISTHLSFRNFDRIEAVCRAGLDHIIVSADGTNQEEYERYRRGGRFDFVLENMRKLVALRDEPGGVSPIIEWQMLSLAHLEEELQNAYEIASEIGVDWFRTRPPIAPPKYQPKDPLLRGHHHGLHKRCSMPWRYIAIQADGGVSACCNTFHKEDDFGDLSTHSIAEIRSNRKFKDARRFFSSKKWKQKPRPNPNHPCLRCPVLHGQRHGNDIRLEFPEAQTDSGFMAVLHTEDSKEMC